MENKKIKAITINDNEEFLRQISQPVDIKNDKDLEKDISVLDEFCKENGVLAMAAVQLGIPKRIVYLKNTNLEMIRKTQNNELTENEEKYNEAKVLINPTILEREGLTEYWEACASCLDNFGLVKRPYKMIIEYIDTNRKKQIETLEGFPSTVLSHELDHLDGILHMDIAEQLLIMKPEARKEYRKTHDYNIITKTSDYEELLNEKKLIKNHRNIVSTFND